MQGVLRDIVNLFNRNLIDLVEHIEALDVFSVALNHINELIHSVISSDGYVSIMNFVFMEHKLAQFLVQMGQFHLSVELNSTGFSLLDCDVWFGFVQSNTDLLKLFG